MKEIIAEEFQRELNTITDTRPPVSKAKMNSIIKCALRLIKFYKYIVYYVECFIKACPSDYKIAGLYVIDAIVRNTKKDKQIDLFEMRFKKNLDKTFVHIYKSVNVDEKEKIVKVLNLWKTNDIFAPDLIDKLIGLSDRDFSNKSNGDDDGDGGVESNKDDDDEQKNHVAHSNHIDNHLDKNDEFELDEVNRVILSTERLKNSITNCSAWILAHNNEKPTEQLNTELVNMEIEDVTLGKDETVAKSTKDSSKPNQFIPPDLTKPPPVLPPCLPQLTNQQYQMFSNILQQQQFHAVNEPQKQSTMEVLNRSPLLHVSKDLDDRKHNSNRDDIDRSRKRKDLPPLKDGHLCVCSKTMWLGHLSKQTTEDDLSRILEDCGKVLDIHMIPPRGCAYILFAERRDAAKCLHLLRDMRINGNLVKIAWAINKGIKAKNKSYWNADLGCTYIPLDELDDAIDVKCLIEGGFIDDESIDRLPLNLSEQLKPLKTMVDEKTAIRDNIEPQTVIFDPNEPQQANKKQATHMFLPHPPPPLSHNASTPPPPTTTTIINNPPQTVPTNESNNNNNNFLEQQMKNHFGLIHHHAQQMQNNPTLMLNQMTPILQPNGFLAGNHLIATQDQLRAHMQPSNGLPPGHIQTLQLSNINGLPSLQMHLTNAMLGHQARYPFQLSTTPSGPHQFQILSRPFLGPDHHHIISNGLIRHIIPGSIVQSVQPADAIKHGEMQNPGNIQLIRLPQTNFNQNSPLPGIHMTHLASTSPSSPQQQQQQLLTLLSNQRPQIPQDPNNSFNQGQHEQFDINSNNNKPQAHTNNTDQINDRSNRNSFPHRPAQDHHHQHRHHQYPQQQQQQQQQQNYFGPNDRHFTPENNKNRISRFDREWPQQQQETFASNGNQQSRMPAKRPYQIDKPYASHQNSRFNNNANGNNSYNKAWRFNKNQQNNQRGFHHNQQAKTGHLNNNSERFQNDDNQVTSV